MRKQEGLMYLVFDVGATFIQICRGWNSGICGADQEGV